MKKVVIIGLALTAGLLAAALAIWVAGSRGSNRTTREGRCPTENAIIRISVATSKKGGFHGAGHSPTISANGRLVAFDYRLPGEKGSKGIFVFDRETGRTEQLKMSLPKAESCRYVSEPAISADGRFVIFGCDDTNLMFTDTYRLADVLLHDRETGKTRRLRVTTSKGQVDIYSDSFSASADGRFVAFRCARRSSQPYDARDERADVFIYDRTSGMRKKVGVGSSGDDVSRLVQCPCISADGRFIAFSSDAADLVPRDTNSKGDTFVYDRKTGVTQRVSVSSSEKEADDHSHPCSITSGGRFVVFYSSATTLVPADTNNASDIFMHDRETGQTERVSVTSSGGEADGDSYHGSISSGGRFVAFQSGATNLVPNDTNDCVDVFVHDRETRKTVRVSITSFGKQAQGYCTDPAISADGRYVAFRSLADDLVPGDTDFSCDVFLVRNPLGP